MSNAKITLIGFYKVFDNLGDDLFKNLKLPEGIDKDTLTDNILLRGGEFEVIYSDPEFLQSAIGSWSNKWARTFTKWIDALNIEYSPLENYDRQEDWTDTNKAKSVGNTTTGSNSNNINTVAGFDSGNLQNSSGSNSYTNGSANDETNTESDGKHIGRTHGNIGVTTSQQMLQSELDIARWNIYEHITDIFLSEFVIPLY